MEIAMKICTFSTMNLSIPMIDIEGTLYTSSAVLADAFCIDMSSIRSVVQRNKDRFSGKTIGDALMCVSEWDARELKGVLNVKQLKKATVLWSHRDLIHLGLLLTGETARAFQEDVIDLIEQQARVDYVPREQFNKLVLENTKMAEFCNSLVERVERLEDSTKQMASNAGRSLRLIKG